MDQQAWCPGCEQVPSGAVCSACGIRLDAPEVPRLRELALQLDQLKKHRDSLVQERLDLMQAVVRTKRLDLRARSPRPPRPVAAPSAPAPALPPPVTGRPRIEVESTPLRNLLLSTGAGLLGLAALIFAFIAWPKLGEGGQALVLLATTLVAAATAWALHERLPATAEAMTAVTILLVLVDAYALRQAGVGGATVSGSQYSAAALALLAAATAAVGRASRVCQVTAALAGPAAAVLAADSVADRAVEWSAWLSVIAAATVAAGLLIDVSRSPRRELPARVLLGVALTIWALAVLSAAAAAVAADPSSAVVVALTALAPLVLTLGAPEDGRFAEWRTGAALGASLAILAAVGVGSAAAGAGRWVPVIVAGTAAAWSAAALGSDRRLVAAGLSGLAVVAGVLVYLAETPLTAVFGPLRWLDRPWTLGVTDFARLPADDLPRLRLPETLAVLGIASAVAVAAAIARREHPEGRFFAAAAAAMVAAAGAVVVLAVDSSVAGAVVSLTAGMALALAMSGVSDRRGASSATPAFIGAAAVFAAPALGWTAANQGLTPAFPVALAVGSGAAAAVARSRWLRQASFAVCVGALMSTAPAVVAAATTSGTARAAGLALAVSAAAVLIAGSLARGGLVVGDGLVEGVGVVGLLVGVSMASDDALSLASTLTLSTAALLAAGGLPRQRRDGYLLAGAAMAVVSSWAWMAVADVELPEAYTLPAAAVSLLVGLEARKRQTGENSWLTIGPGLLIAFAPSLMLGLSERGWVRPVVLAGAAVAAVSVGAASKLQAPLAIGSTVIVILGVDAIAPALGEVPRWASIGGAGVILLWLGATAEKRVADVREWRAKYEALESRPPAAPSSAPE